MIANIVVVAAFVVVYVRLFFGVNLTDEPQVILMALAQAKGQGIFASDLIIHQTSSWLLSIPVRAFLLVSGGDVTGLVFALRQLLFFQMLAFFFIVRSRLKGLFPTEQATLFAAVLAMFNPGSILIPTYNNMFYFFMVIGAVYLFLEKPKDRPSTALIGTACLALAGFIYPPMTPVCFAAIIFYLWASHGKQLRPWINHGTVFFIFSGAAIFLIQWHRVLELFQYLGTLGAQGGGISKIRLLAAVISTEWLLFFGVAGIFLIALWGSRRATAICFLALASYATYRIFKYDGVQQCLLFLILTGIALRLLFRKHDPWIQGFFPMALFSLLLGFIGAWASSGGLYAAWMGWNLGAVAVISQYWYTKKISNFGLWIICLPLIAYQIYRPYHDHFQDGETTGLTVWVGQGAYKGLLTTIETKNYITEIEKTLSDIEKEGRAKTILTFYNVPGIYLMTKLEKDAPTFWIFSPIWIQHDETWFVNYYRDHHFNPDLVLYVKRVPMEIGKYHEMVFNEKWPLYKTILTDQYRPLLETENFKIFKKTVLF